MNNPRSTILAGLFLSISFSTAPVFAVMLTPSSSAQVGRDTHQEVRKPISQAGTIKAINIASQTISIDDSTYMFVPSLTKVYSSDPHLNGNPLKLEVGYAIHFHAVPEGNGKFRVTSIAIKK